RSDTMTLAALKTMDDKIRARIAPLMRDRAFSEDAAMAAVLKNDHALMNEVIDALAGCTDAEWRQYMDEAPETSAPVKPAAKPVKPVPAVPPLVMPIRRFSEPERKEQPIVSTPTPKDRDTVWAEIEQEAASHRAGEQMTKEKRVTSYMDA